jgi:hypothetical protein
MLLPNPSRLGTLTRTSMIGQGYSVSRLFGQTICGNVNQLISFLYRKGVDARGGQIMYQSDEIGASFSIVNDVVHHRDSCPVVVDVVVVVVVIVSRK